MSTEAAKLIDVTLVFKTKAVDVYKNGKKIESVAEKDGKLIYTGNTPNVAIIAVSVATIAIAAVVIKKTVFAR